MQLLPNGCRVDNISVHPKDWETTKRISCNWHISYRFYDDNFRTQFPKGKQVFIKGMNDHATAIERREITKALIKDELRRLKDDEYNPITKKFKVVQPQHLNGHDLNIIDALKFAFKELMAVKKTKGCIDNAMGFFYRSLVDLGCDKFPIAEVKRAHVRAAIDNQERFKKVWSANQFNTTRKYLSILYSQLVELEMVESNFIDDIKKRKHVKKIRRLLDENDKAIINEKIKVMDPRFWLFIKIFFHSGARITEFCRLQLKDIDLANQKIKVTILKGKDHIEVEKPIKNVAVKYWTEWIGQNKDPELYFVSKGLEVGATPIREEQITKRWLRLAKRKLGIEADFYALKHTNTDESSELVGIANAMKLNSHTNVKTTEIYAVNEKHRQNEVIKNIDNDF